jgi:hypothetical protein
MSTMVMGQGHTSQVTHRGAVAGYQPPPLTMYYRVTGVRPLAEPPATLASSALTLDAPMCRWFWSHNVS